MNKVILAVDPGLNGGFGWKSNGVVACHKMFETDGDVLDFIKSLSIPDTEKIAYVEKVGGFAGNNKSMGSAMFGFGHGRGFIMGCLMSLGWRILEPIPRKWQMRLGLGTATSCETSTVWKNKLKAEAQRRYPALKITLATADALLILDYAVEFEEKGATA
jgi:hypothetical protein